MSREEAKDSVLRTLSALYEAAREERSQGGLSFGLTLCASGGASLAASWLLGVPGASNCILGISYPYSEKEMKHYLGTTPTSGFCSTETTIQLARVARNRSMEIQAEDLGVDSLVRNDAAAIGVAFTGVLATNREHKGAHRGIVCVSDKSGREIVHAIEFEKGARSREQEDFFASYLVIHAIHDYVKNYLPIIGTKLPTLCWDLSRNGIDSISFDKDIIIPSQVEASKEAIKRAFDSKEDKSYAMYWPRITGQEFLPYLPLQGLYTQGTRLLILSGSFNPLHNGHESLAIAAMNRIKAKKEDHNFEILFEIAIKNADKGQINVTETERRVEQFQKENTKISNYGPWPVILTTEPLFLNKARMLPNSIFVIGADTALRLINPDYYEGSMDKMVSALMAIRLLGCSFIVGGRLNKISQRFETFEDIKGNLPSIIDDMFLSLSEEEFRIDISSTEIRNSNM